MKFRLVIIISSPGTHSKEPEGKLPEEQEFNITEDDVFVHEGYR